MKKWLNSKATGFSPYAMTTNDQLAAIVHACANAYNVPAERLIRPERGNHQTGSARQIAMYLCCKLTTLNRFQIGRVFAKRSRESVDTAYRNTANRIKHDQKHALIVESIRQAIAQTHQPSTL